MCTCKCGARTYTAHLARVADGFPGHTYRGSVWQPGHAPQQGR